MVKRPPAVHVIFKESTTKLYSMRKTLNALNWAPKICALCFTEITLMYALRENAMYSINAAARAEPTRDFHSHSSEEWPKLGLLFTHTMFVSKRLSRNKE